MHCTVFDSIYSSLLGSKGFHFWQKTEETMKTGGRDENIDF